eukprot:2941454-Alexandrium_andersonii.AAC.1
MPPVRCQTAYIENNLPLPIITMGPIHAARSASGFQTTLQCAKAPETTQTCIRLPPTGCWRQFQALLG